MARSGSATPARVTKCRTCHGARKMPSTCPGITWCSSGSEGYSYEWGSRPDEHCEHGLTTSHRLPCRHGYTSSHITAYYDCWRCHGVGRCDYGSNPVHYRWDGEPLRIDSDGSPLGPAVSVSGHQSYGDSGALPRSQNYGDSGDLLRSVLPALSIFTPCPHCELKVSLERVVIHLNDSAQWSRERVADWLDTLDLDLSFPVPDHIPAHIS